MKKEAWQKGSATLETSIVLPLFILLFLGIYGIFSVFSARNRIANALLQSANSLALDAYITERVDSAAEKGSLFWGGLSDVVQDIIRLEKDKHFMSAADWWDYEKDSLIVAKYRFIGYLSGGDEQAADQDLKSMGIENGFDGLFFETEVKGEDLTICVSYKIKFLFDFWGMGMIPMKQSVTIRLWK